MALATMTSERWKEDQWRRRTRRTRSRSGSGKGERRGETAKPSIGTRKAQTQAHNTIDTREFGWYGAMRWCVCSAVLR